MTDIRQLRAQARRDLHERAKVPAFYISPFNKLGPRFVYVRLHDHQRGKTGGLSGNRDWAQNVDVRPRIIMMRERLPFCRQNSIFTFGPGEAYKVEAVEPPDGTTITAICSRLSKSEADTYPYPLPGDELDPPNPDPDPENPGSGSGNVLYYPLLTPTTQYEVIHNLGKIPNVIILDNTEREIFAEIEHDRVGMNKFTVRFNPPVIGEIIVS